MTTCMSSVRWLRSTRSNIRADMSRRDTYPQRQLGINGLIRSSIAHKRIALPSATNLVLAWVGQGGNENLVNH